MFGRPPAERRLATAPCRVFIPSDMNPATGNQSKPIAYIVDDEPMLLDLNESMLRSMGFEVRRFRAAELAFESYRRETCPPAIIVTDFSMHKMTGLDLIQACREIHPGQKFLLLSGTVNASIFANVHEKPDDFMPKPYEMDKFSSVVRSLTG